MLFTLPSREFFVDMQDVFSVAVCLLFFFFFVSWAEVTFVIHQVLLQQRTIKWANVRLHRGDLKAKRGCLGTAHKAQRHLKWISIPWLFLFPLWYLRPLFKNISPFCSFSLPVYQCCLSSLLRSPLLSPPPPLSLRDDSHRFICTIILIPHILCWQSVWGCHSLNKLGTWAMLIMASALNNIPLKSKT